MANIPFSILDSDSPWNMKRTRWTKFVAPKSFKLPILLYIWICLNISIIIIVFNKHYLRTFFLLNMGLLDENSVTNTIFKYYIYTWGVRNEYLFLKRINILFFLSIAPCKFFYKFRTKTINLKIYGVIFLCRKREVSFFFF